MAAEAERRGQAKEEFAQAVLEERLAPTREVDRREERTPEQMLDDFFARFPRSAPEELVEMARQQGVQPIPDLERPLGVGPEGENEFDVDAFLTARKQWQWEGRPPGAGLADAEDRRE